MAELLCPLVAYQPSGCNVASAFDVDIGSLDLPGPASIQITPVGDASVPSDSDGTYLAADVTQEVVFEGLGLSDVNRLKVVQGTDCAGSVSDVLYPPFWSTVHDFGHVLL